ncbi:MAG: gfo/Idh/MocA family oxidoreductase [Euryarchaeota archaeon]|nr:gfo/Idh/MocA family oxidoreductase [Euryarchaeota archaeon]
MIKFALIGCGRISKRHSELLGFNKIRNASLVAVCDLDIKKAEAIGKQFNIKTYTDMHQMMNDVDVDVVVVLTESGNHSKHVLELAKYKKHIMVEKPMALTLEDADKMILACAENQVKLFVVKQNRFNLPIRRAREAVEAGRLGKMVMGTVRVRWCRDDAYYKQDAWRGTWAQDGGVLANQASHHVDVLEWMMGEVESVYAVARTALVDIDVEDTAVAVLKFTSGAIGLVEATTATRPIDLEGSLSLLGEKGTIVVGGFALNRLETWNFSDLVEDDSVTLEEFSVNPPDVYGFGHRMYLEHVVDCIRDNSRQLVDGAEGRRSLELILAIYESIETGREVSLKDRPTHSKLGRKS